MIKRIHVFPAVLAAFLTLFLAGACQRGLADGEYTLTVLSTNDVHGSWFDESYTGGPQRKSLLALNYYVDSVRTADGAGNVLLIDAGDCLQGDNAAYYFNYIDTLTPHLFPRLVEYMHYDAVVVGNHDIETGHRVYDRVAADLQKAGIPFLAGNYPRNDGKGSYFPLYKVFKKAGLKVAVIGYGNANIKGWLSEKIWSGMDFVSITQVIQRDVDLVRAKERPDVVVVAMHSGTGPGDGSILESQAMDSFNLVNGVDWIICAHDHRPYVEARDSSAFLNSGSHSRFLAHGKLHLTVKDRKVVAKSYEADLIPVKAEKADPQMRATFQKDFDAVKAFTLQEVGILNVDLRTREAYVGMSPYINLLHTLGLGCTPAEVSFAAPLTYNGTINAGVLRFNDLFTIYPFENQLFVVDLSGAEIRNYLEASYDRWIGGTNGHVLRISPRDDPRTQQVGWSFDGRTYNFDSAGGVRYTVDITQPRGKRVNISSMADGTPFDETRMYHVAMTSYRASGGGELLKEAGVDVGQLDERVVARYQEIRNLLYEYLMKNGSIDPEVIGDESVIGHWQFIPEKEAAAAISRDMELVFRKN